MATEDEHSGTETPRTRRHSLRHATVILPQTGERSRRKVTLRGATTVYNPPNTGGAEADERTPLLPTSNDNRDQTAREGRYRISARIAQWAQTTTGQVWNFLCSRDGKNVVKSSLAYLLASLAVFVPWFARLLGSGDGKHLVANIIVWYNPARSFGSMTQGTMFATIAFIFSATVCYTSMGVATLFDHLNLLPLGHAIILIVFCGGSLGLMSWVKQRLGDILVNVSVSLASIPIVTMSTKEPAVHYGFVSHAVTSQTLRMAVLAIAISTLVNILVWPITARKDLRENLTKATDGLGYVLASTTTSFLSGCRNDMKDSDEMNTAITTLAKNLAEARNEYYIAGLERQYAIEQRLVQCIQRLSQDIGGLQSAASTQFSLLDESAEVAGGVQSDDSSDSIPKATDYVQPSHETANIATSDTPRLSSSPKPIATPRLSSPPLGNSMSSIITMIRRQTNISDSGRGSGAGSITESQGRETENFSAESAADIFETFVDQLGPPMKSLAYTLQQILVDLPFGPAPAYAVVNNPTFRSSLKEALQLFSSSRREALAAVYKSKHITLEKSYWVAADFEEVAASCGHFSSSLQDLAENVIEYLDVLDELEEETTERSRGRSWRWLFFWRKTSPQDASERELGNATDDSQRTHHPLPTTLSEIPSRSIKHPPTEVAAGQSSLRYQIWLWLSFMRRDDIRFAVKVGAGGALFALFAYLPLTEPLFFHWRLEWSLATYMFVCSMTIGAANTTTIKRLIGTSIGAVLAILVWVLSDDSPYVLAFLGWLVSLGCFYIMIVKNEGPMARFILLTYNLSVLYSYSLSVNDEDDDEDEGGINPAIFEIVLHRLIAICIGCIYGLLVTRLIWPISARKKLKSGLALLWLRMALIWKRAPLSLLTDRDAPPSYMDIREEFRLRDFAALLETMRAHAAAEVTLRRAFQTAPYARILRSTGRMLDALHALNVAIAKDSKASPGELAILRYTQREREQLAARIAHLLAVLAASIKLEYPLTDTLPDIAHTRDRLLARVFAFRQDAARSSGVRDDDYEVLYTYALVTGQIAKEVAVTGAEMEKLYGVLDEHILRLQ